MCITRARGVRRASPQHLTAIRCTVICHVPFKKWPMRSGSASRNANIGVFSCPGITFLFVFLASLCVALCFHFDWRPCARFLPRKTNHEHFKDNIAAQQNCNSFLNRTSAFSQIRSWSRLRQGPQLEPNLAKADSCERSGSGSGPG